nr:hypothetical protein [Tanacetum cinerariifolium]
AAVALAGGLGGARTAGAAGPTPGHRGQYVYEPDGAAPGLPAGANRPGGGYLGYRGAAVALGAGAGGGGRSGWILAAGARHSL